jgi:hypothetical protein
MSYVQFQGRLPNKTLGAGDHFYNKRTLTRRMDSVVADVSSQRIAVLQMGQTMNSKSRRGVKVGLRP